MPARVSVSSGLPTTSFTPTGTPRSVGTILVARTVRTSNKDKTFLKTRSRASYASGSLVVKSFYVRWSRRLKQVIPRSINRPAANCVASVRKRSLRQRPMSTACLRWTIDNSEAKPPDGRWQRGFAGVGRERPLRNSVHSLESAEREACQTWSARHKRGTISPDHGERKQRRLSMP